jgi:endonuclease YncB( thermonuclease family)
MFWSGEYGKTIANISVSCENWPSDDGGKPSVYIGVDGINYGHSMVTVGDVLLENYAG